MGVITSLIRANRDKKSQDEEHQLRAFTLAAQSDDPSLKQWGIQSITDLGMKNAPNPEVKKHIPVLGKIAGLMGQMGSQLNPMPGAPKLSRGVAPEYSQERADQEASRRAMVEESRQAAVAARTASDMQAVNEIKQRNAWKAELDEDDHDSEMVKSGRMSQDQADERLRNRRGIKPERGDWVQGKIGAMPVKFNRVTGEYRTMDDKPYVPTGDAVFEPSSTTIPAETTTTVELADGTVVPALKNKLGDFTSLDKVKIDPKTIRAVGVPIEPKLSGELKTRADAHKILKDPKSTPEELAAAKETLKSLNEKAQGVTIRNEMAREASDDAPPANYKPGSREYGVAQGLAYGKLTFAQFRGLYSYSRNANKRADIYNLAMQLNPNFNPAEFEMGYTLAKNPKVQQQLASLDNVVSGIDDLLKFSDAASRTGAPILNKFIVPGGILIGGKKYANFDTAVDAFADELSGGLGFGTATDMKLKLGMTMTNRNLSPEVFRSNVEDVLKPFVNRKRQTLLDQMGPYGKPGMNPAADKAEEQKSLKPPKAGAALDAETAKKYMTVSGGDKAKARAAAVADGWSVK